MIKVHQGTTTREELTALVIELRGCTTDRTHAAEDPPVLVPASLVARVVAALETWIVEKLASAVETFAAKEGK